MKASITKIGNSKGLIIPAQLLKQCGFEDEVSLKVKDDSLVVSRAHKPREGWEQAFMQAGADQEEALTADFSNDFDEDEWTW